MACPHGHAGDAANGPLRVAYDAVPHRPGLRSTQRSWVAAVLLIFLWGFIEFSPKPVLVFPLHIFAPAFFS